SAPPYEEERHEARHHRAGAGSTARHGVRGAVPAGVPPRATHARVQAPDRVHRHPCSYHPGGADAPLLAHGHVPLRAPDVRRGDGYRGGHVPVAAAVHAAALPDHPAAPPRPTEGVHTCVVPSRRGGSAAPTATAAARSTRASTSLLPAVPAPPWRRRSRGRWSRSCAAGSTETAAASTSWPRTARATASSFRIRTASASYTAT